MGKDSFPSANQDKYVLRLPDGMRDRIRETAAANNRSMNAEIVARLEASFDSSNSDLRRVAERIADEAIDYIRDALEGTGEKDAG